MNHRTFTALVVATAIALAAHGQAPTPEHPPEAKSETERRGVPLEARLIAKKDTYVLDLGGKTPEEFRKLLKDTVPPAPDVDLELEFRNSGDKDFTFLVGGSNPDIPLLLKLDGPGAVNKVLPAIHAGIVSMPPKKVTLAPGKTHTLPIKGLMTSHLGREGTASYWTGPGDYTLVATYKTAVSPVPDGAKDDGSGFGPVTVISAPAKLKVAEKEKQQKDNKSGDERKSDDKSRTEPPGVPLEARLVAKTNTYALDLGGKTPAEFRKLIEDSQAAAPAVDLELEFRNNGDQDLTLLVGGFAPDIPLLLKLEGPGAVNVTLEATHKAIKSEPPKQVTLAPGKSHILAIKSLRTNSLNRDGTASYWTEPGEYTLVATYKTAVSPVPAGAKDNGSGFGPVTVISAPVKLKVVEKGKEDKDEKDNAPELQELSIDTPNGWWLRCFPDGSGSVGFGSGICFAKFKAGTIDFAAAVKQLREATVKNGAIGTHFAVGFHEKGSTSTTSVYTKDAKLVLGLFDKAADKKAADIPGGDEFDKVWKDNPPSLKRD